ncbi:hypothetical protein [Yersinia mollaretii]|nr:hypothetical protein [Yersinia mollaretii]WQC75158.1 hypothetical protein U1Z61_00980 [Yersinia mollaretii]
MTSDETTVFVSMQKLMSLTGVKESNSASKTGVILDEKIEDLCF